MTIASWYERTIEERNLLNPAFCAVVLWHLVRGYQLEREKSAGSKAGFPFELTFVGASFVLRGQTRDKLPRTISTSMVAWIRDHALERSAVAKGVTVLRPYVREAVIFGSQQGILRFEGSELMAMDDVSKRITAYLKKATPEVLDCTKKATLVGRWMHKSGTPSTVVALAGLRT